MTFFGTFFSSLRESAIVPFAFTVALLALLWLFLWDAPGPDGDQYAEGL